MTPVRGSQAKLVASHIRAVQLVALLNETHHGGAWPLFRETAKLLQETIDALNELVTERDSLNPPNRDDHQHPSVAPISPSLFTVVEAPNFQSDPCGDTAFIAATQLRRKQTQISTCTQSSAPAALLDGASTGLRNVLRAVCAVEPVLAKAYGLAPRLKMEPLLEASILVRRAYTTFRLSVVHPSDERLDRLMVVRNALYDLARNPAAQHYRLSDRKEIACLQERLETLASEQPQGSVYSTAIEHAIGDVIAFSEVLAGVGRRPELVAHDLRVLPTIIEQVQANLAQGKPVLLGHLERVRGVDDALELFIRTRGVPDSPYLVLELNRILTERRRAVGVSW